MMVSINTWLSNWRNIVSWNYLVDRMDFNFINTVINQSRFEYSHPLHPWITPDMIKILQNLLREDDVGFEFGSGNSTVWFAQNTKFIHSVEHDRGWFNKVKKMIQIHHLKLNTDLIYVKQQTEIEYIKPISKIKNNSLDYCFVDGIFRDQCVLSCIPKLKSSGILIVDNVDNYFPKNKISVSVRYKRDNYNKTVSPKKMKLIYETLSDWRKIWTSTGIQDTALWIKP